MLRPTRPTDTFRRGTEGRRADLGNRQRIALTTKPEVLVSIVIDWKAITRATPALSKGNFIQSIEQNYEGGTVHPVPLSPENLLREAKQGRFGKPVLPAGAACMMQAAQPGFLEKMLDLDVERKSD